MGVTTKRLFDTVQQGTHDDPHAQQDQHDEKKSSLSWSLLMTRMGKANHICRSGVARLTMLTVACFSLFGGFYYSFNASKNFDRSNLLESSTRTASPSTATTSSSTTMMLDLPPGTKTVILNIGSNLDPIVPRKTDGPCTSAIAFEPIVSCQIPKTHPRLQVVPAAIGATHGLATMTVMNESGQSSSLSKAATSSFWNNNPDRGDGQMKIVPVLPLRDVIQSIPSNVDIDFILTDMQGYDFMAIQSAGDFLAQRNVKRLKTEVYMDDTVTYVGVHNDFCRDWLPYMLSIGYELVHLSGSGYANKEQALESCSVTDGKKEEEKVQRLSVAGLKEADALWRLSSLFGSDQQDDLKLYSYPTIQHGQPFSDEEYASCAKSL